MARKQDALVGHGELRLAQVALLSMRGNPDPAPRLDHDFGLGSSHGRGGAEFIAQLSGSLLRRSQRSDKRGLYTTRFQAEQGGVGGSARRGQRAPGSVINP